jgi:endonuclease/exonuclease/phosphatase (EEP) superfamily protein YafD
VLFTPEQLIYFFVALAALFTGLFTLLGFFGRFWWVFDLFSHFRLQYFLVLTASTLIFALDRQAFPTLGAACLAIVNLVMILVFYRITPRRPPSGKTYRLLFSNVLGTNKRYGEILRLIHTSDADIVLLVEPTYAWVHALESLNGAYPYRQGSPRGDNYGIALLSRLPFISSDVVTLGPYGKPSIIARLELDGKPLTLIGTHAPPPFDREGTETRDHQIAEIIQLLPTLPSPILLAGDFNATSWSKGIQVLLRSGLQDSRLGFGLQPSWPTHNPFLRVPIDHVFVSPGVNILDRRLGPNIGSDHFPVIVDFYLE